MVELWRKYTICLRQKALEDGLLRFLRGKTQCLQLQQLIPGDLADGGLVDQLGVRTVGGDGGDGLDVGLLPSSAGRESTTLLSRNPQ